MMDTLIMLAVTSGAVDGVVSDSATTLLQLGVAGVFIIFLIVSVVQLYRENKRIQDQRLVEAKETRDNIGETMSKLGSQQDKIYDILLNNKRRG